MSEPAGRGFQTTNLPHTFARWGRVFLFRGSAGASVGPPPPSGALHPGQSKTFHVKSQANGVDVPVPQPVVWTAEPPGIVALAPASDGLSVVVTYQAPGTATVRVTAGVASTTVTCA